MLLTKFLSLLFLVFSFSCNTEHHFSTSVESDIQVEKSQLELKATEGLFYYGNTSFTGTSIASYPNEVLSESIQFRNGKKHGLFKKWYSNGQISFEGTYKDGRLDGKVTTWWKDGTIRSEANYVSGVLSGVQKQWYSSGSLFKQLTYVDGKEEGLQKAWRENGKIYNNYEAKNGRIFGLKRANLCYELSDEIIL